MIFVECKFALSPLSTAFCRSVNQQIHGQDYDTLGRQKGNMTHGDSMELVETTGHVTAATSFGKKEEESKARDSPKEERLPMSVVAMQLADAGPDLESSDDEEQQQPHTPMLSEPVCHYSLHI